jgi:hypothetical protein
VRSPLGELNNKGNYSNLFKGFKGINNSRINKRDVYFNNFNKINGFNVLRKIIEGGIIYSYKFYLLLISYLRTSRSK